MSSMCMRGREVYYLVLIKDVVQATKAPAISTIVSNKPYILSHNCCQSQSSKFLVGYEAMDTSKEKINPMHSRSLIHPS